MPFGVLNLDFSNDEAGKNEREQLCSLASAPILSNERTLYLKINCINLPMDGDYSKQTVQQYIQSCSELIRYCDQQLEKAHFTARSLAILRLKVRVENIKKKCESGDRNILKCYEIEGAVIGQRYTNLELFRKTDASLEPTVLKLAQERLPLCLSSNVGVVESPAISWVMQNSDPKDPKCYNIAYSLCSHALMSMVFQSLPESFNSILESLLQSPTILQRLHGNNSLLQFLTILSQRNPKFGECLLQNIEVIEFLVTSDTRGLEFLRTLTPKTVFRQALQKGFKYKDLLNFVQTNFSLYRNEVSLILYEAMSKGDWSTVASLKSIFKLHVNDQIKTKESYQAQTQFFESSETKSVVKTSQETCGYREEIAFELEQLTDYLVERFEQNKLTKDADPNSQQSKPSLYFIDHLDDFVGLLEKNGFIAENAVEEFKLYLSKRLDLKSSAPVNYDLVAQNKELLEKLTVSLKEIGVLTSRVTQLERSQEKLQNEIENLKTAAASHRVPGIN